MQKHYMHKWFMMHSSVHYLETIEIVTIKTIQLTAIVLALVYYCIYQHLWYGLECDNTLASGSK